MLNFVIEVLGLGGAGVIVGYWWRGRRSESGRPVKFVTHPFICDRLGSGCGMMRMTRCDLPAEHPMHQGEPLTRY